MKEIKTEEGKFYMVKYEDDWADEFDVSGLKLLKHDEVDDMLNIINNAKYPKSFCFGSNEEITWPEKGEILNAIEVIEIGKTTYDSMMKIFRYGEFGHFPEFSEILGDW